MGSTTTKTIKGNEYLYYVYYENRKKKEVYCGLASDKQSEKKALQFDGTIRESEKEFITKGCRNRIQDEISLDVYKFLEYGKDLI